MYASADLRAAGSDGKRDEAFDEHKEKSTKGRAEAVGGKQALEVKKLK